VVNGPQQVAAEPEDILHDAVDGSESLKLPGRFETPHLGLSLADRLFAYWAVT
jgi:hypothetical protein